MTDINNLPLFLAAALLIAVTPGPGIFYVAARTLAGGRGEGMASSIGLGLGGLLHVIGGAIGISALVMASAEAFTMVKVLGAVYLIWLGLKAWREARVLLPTDVRTTGFSHSFRSSSMLRSP
jgi:threonine/homoserine/homoserine lactone efflux protein